MGAMGLGWWLTAVVSNDLKLICLKGPAPAFDPKAGTAGLPKRFKVFPWGESKTAKGPVICNATTIAEMPKQHKLLNWDRTALDFDHNSVPTSATYKGEPVKIAGYGDLEVVDGEGVYITMSSWTKDGEDYAGGGHYGDLSPVVMCNAANEIIAIHSVALCRHGATPDLQFLSAPSPIMKKDNQDPKPPQNAEELMEALKSALKLSADSTPGQVLEGLTKALSATVEKKPEGDDKKKAVTTEPTPDLAQLSSSITELQDQIKLLTSGVEERDRAEILAACAREGKVVPKSAERLPLATLRSLAGELPVTVPLEARTPPAGAVTLSSQPAVSAEHASIDSVTGVSEEDRKKYLA